jgi:hypothetical protein
VLGEKSFDAVMNALQMAAIQSDSNKRRKRYFPPLGILSVERGRDCLTLNLIAAEIEFPATQFDDLKTAFAGGRPQRRHSH